MISKPFEPELEPCPFCGGEASVSEGTMGGKPSWYIECCECSAMVDEVELWNRRVLRQEGREQEWNSALDAAARIVCRDCQGCGNDAILALKRHGSQEESR